MRVICIAHEVFLSIALILGTRIDSYSIKTADMKRLQIFHRSFNNELNYMFFCLNNLPIHNYLISVTNV